MGTTRLTGTVKSGGSTNYLPLPPGITVTLYSATVGEPIVVASALTGAGGNFTLASPTDSAGGIFYVAATMEGGLKLVTVIGAELPDSSITVNELTTVAAAFSFAQCVQDGVIAGNSPVLRIAAGMNDNLVDTSTGEPSGVLQSSPNADETNSLRSTRALANLLVPGARQQPGAVSALLALATPPGGDRPGDTFQALVNIALYPANNVADVYTQSKAAAPQVYQPSLETQPDAWTVAVKVNDSGSDRSPFGGPANIAFDRNGYAWITNNVVQGTPNSTRAGLIVLKPNGRPADGRGDTPDSPITGGGLLGPGFGVAIDTHGNVWVGDFGWGDDKPSPHGNGSVSQFDPLGRPISGDEGYQSGTYRVQGAAVDKYDNVWLASYQNNRVFVFLGGDPENAISAPDTGGGTATFDVAIAEDQSAWVTYSGDLASGSKSRLCRYAIENGALVQLSGLDVGVSLKGISLDSQGNAWVASGGEDAVYYFSPEGVQLGKFVGVGGIVSPWSVEVDGDDNVWVANFGPTGFGTDYTNAAVSKLAGVRRPGGLDVGDPISPETGYTLPSAGSQVLLHNGDPLYGRGAEPYYTPLMRQTACRIDQAGNVWAINNWKPNWNLNTAPGGDPDKGNPGGDGIVIFVGLAKPPTRQH